MHKRVLIGSQRRAFQVFRTVSGAIPIPLFFRRELRGEIKKALHQEGKDRTNARVRLNSNVENRLRGLNLTWQRPSASLGKEAFSCEVAPSLVTENLAAIHIFSKKNWKASLLRFAASLATGSFLSPDAGLTPIATLPFLWGIRLC